MARSELRPYPPMAVPSPVVADTTIATHPVPPPMPLDVTEGSVGQLVIRLGELSELRRKALLTNAEFEAKKDQLLAKQVRSTNLTPELEQIGELQRNRVISAEEHDTLKKKILGTETQTRKN